MVFSQTWLPLSVTDSITWVKWDKWDTIGVCSKVSHLDEREELNMTNVDRKIEQNPHLMVYNYSQYKL